MLNKVALTIKSGFNFNESYWKQFCQVVLFTISYKVAFALNSGLNNSVWIFWWDLCPRHFVWCLFAVLQEQTLSRLSSLTYLHCWTRWLWTSTEHVEDRHDLVTMVMAAWGCTVSLGCSRRLDHRVIKMDLLPSFSQPNVRENNPLISNAANFIAIRYKHHLR